MNFMHSVCMCFNIQYMNFYTLVLYVLSLMHILNAIAKAFFCGIFSLLMKKNELLSLIRLERNIWLFSCVVVLFNAVHKIHEITL